MAEKSKKLGIDQVTAMVNSQKSDAMAAQAAAQLAQDRARSMDYYLGRMENDMPTEDGRSQAVSTDVADTIEGMLPHLIDIFGDNPAKFEPVGPEDEEAAEQETDYIVDHVFMAKNRGLLVLYNFFKDALLLKNAFVKVIWEEREEEVRETYSDLTDEQYAMVAFTVQQSNGALEITEHTEKPMPNMAPQGDNMPAQMQQPMLHDVVIVSTRKLAGAKVYGVPPEEIGIERAARSLQDCNYFFHQVVTKTEADLIDEGFDEDQIKAVTEYTGVSDIETIERDTVYEHQAITGSTAINPAARIVLITEHYIRMDYEGTGRPELYQVITGGDQGVILKKDGKDCITKFDMIPFASATPVPQPHRFFGRSIADLVMEEQREKTALKRGLLDNIYLHNNTRMEVAEGYAGPNTLDDLLVSRPGGIVRTKNPGGLIPIPVQDVTAAIYPALQYLDAVLESKTGLAKQTQGIDANALQNQSATAVAQVFSASQMRIKLIARLLGEGVRDMFALLHATVRKHGGQQETVRLRNKWINVDPRNWKTREDMTINVGLGTGGKAQAFAMQMQIANMQKELLMGGKANLVDDSGLYNTAAELAKIMGHKDPNKFFNDPKARDPQTGQLLHPPPPPAPDPKLQIEMAKAQGQQQNTQAQLILQKQKTEADAQHQMLKTQAEITLQQEKAKLEAELALIDAQLKKDEAARQAALHAQEMHHKQIEHEHKVAQLQLSLAANQQSHEANMATTNQKMAAETQKKQTHASRDLSPVIEKLTQHLEAGSKPKKAKRMPDGSWLVEPVH